MTCEHERLDNREGRVTCLDCGDEVDMVEIRHLERLKSKWVGMIQHLPPTERMVHPLAGPILDLGRLIQGNRKRET